MYAVFSTGGKQYRATAGDVLKVEKLEVEKGSTVEFDQVLMVGEGEEVQIGTPLVDGGTVTAKVVEHGRGEKIRIIKFRRRKHHRKQMGHRQYFTKLEITDISVAGGGRKKPAKKAAEKAPEKPAPQATEQRFLDAPQGAADDLKQISGVGPVIEQKLNDLGIYHFSQVAEFTPEQIAFVDEKLNFKGRIERDDWLAQAAKLAAGGDEEE